MSRTFKPAASKSPVLGIDVSRFQGTIDWDQVAAARFPNPVTGKSEKIRFAYIRASGNGYVDANFARNWREAKRVGILRGPYIGITASAHRADEGGPLADATVYYTWLARALAEGGGYNATDLPPMLDHEKGQSDAPTPAESRLNVAVVRGIADLIAREMGRTAGVYSGAYWQWEVPPDVQGALARHPLWVPDYTRSGGSQLAAGAPWGAKVPDGWSGFYIRQIGSTYRIPGITANTVDVNLYDGGLPSLILFVARSHITAIPWWGYAAILAVLGVVGFALMGGLS